MELIIGIGIGLIVLMILVGLHELGHAIVARRNGVIVKEFAIGFPPRAITKTPKRSFLGKNVQYSFNWLPLGGYVRMKGEYDSSNKKGDYGAAGYWAKTKILFAGVAANWVVAVVLLTILAWAGLPKIIDNQFTVAGDTRTVVDQSGRVQVVQVQEGSMAKQLGLRSGDRIIKINQQVVTSAASLRAALQEVEGKMATVAYERDGATEMATIPRSTATLGVTLAEQRTRELRYSTWSAPVVGVGTTLQFTALSFQGLGDLAVKLVTGLVEKFNPNQEVRTAAGQKIDEVGKSVAGPVGMLGVIFPQAGQAGVTAILLLAALISLSLAVMNVLPIPALDGGRWLVMTLYRVRNKVLTKEREETIQAIGMMILLGLMILITIADIGKVL